MAVELTVEDGKGRPWQVDFSDGQFVTRRFHPEDRATPQHNFKQTAYGMLVRGWYMAYDLGGKSKEVLARERHGEDTQWEKDGGQFGARLRVRNGALNSTALRLTRGMS